MESYLLKIRSIEKATHDVLRITLDKPAHFHFNPGQATEVSINKPGWEDEKHPFTFTSTPADGHLEFTIKTYPPHKGITNELLSLKAGDELIVREPWGTSGYKGEGLFIAGGAGVTPFISIFRHLWSQNKIGSSKLIFANKTKADIINESEFKKMLGKNFINILSEEKSGEYAYGFITKDFLKEILPGVKGHFYLCGPPAMMEAVEKQLISLGITDEQIVKERF